MVGRRRNWNLAIRRCWGGWCCNVPIRGFRTGWCPSKCCLRNRQLYGLQLARTNTHITGSHAPLGISLPAVGACRWIWSVDFLLVDRFILFLLSTVFYLLAFEYHSYTLWGIPGSSLRIFHRTNSLLLHPRWKWKSKSHTHQYHYLQVG